MLRYRALCAIVLLGLPIFFCCGLKNRRKVGPDRNALVKGTLFIEQPVCGTTPQPSGKQIYSNALFFLKKGTSNNADSAIVASFTTDENGMFQLKLPIGTYSLIQKDKLMNYGEFKLKHSQHSNYFRVLDDDCFRRWYQSADFLLKVGGDTAVTFMAKFKCYIKSNPCLEYIGPN